MQQAGLHRSIEPGDSGFILSYLTRQTGLYGRSKDCMEFPDFVSRTRDSAPFNAFLLHLQKPGLRFAAAQPDWRTRFSRHIKPGARPLIVLRPFCPVDPVYDIDDTIDPDLPDSVLHAFSAGGNRNNLIIAEQKEFINIAFSNIGSELMTYSYRKR